MLQVEALRVIDAVKHSSVIPFEEKLAKPLGKLFQECLVHKVIMEISHNSIGSWTSRCFVGVAKQTYWAAWLPASKVPSTHTSELDVPV